LELVIGGQFFSNASMEVLGIEGLMTWAAAAGLSFVTLDF
jgi:hypothetical protein